MRPLVLCLLLAAAACGGSGAEPLSPKARLYEQCLDEIGNPELCRCVVVTTDLHPPGETRDELLELCREMWE